MSGERLRTVQKIMFSTLAGGVLVARKWFPDLLIKDSATVALLVLVALPWLDALIDMAELPGGWKIKFKEVKDQLTEQQKVINVLVKYGMSRSIFEHLCGIALLREYLLEYHDVNRRELYFLRDNGLIQPRQRQGFLDFPPGSEKLNVAEIAEPTSVGWEFVRLRSAEIPPRMRTDLANLRASLESVLGDVG